MCAKLRTVAARDHARNLSLHTLVVTFNRSHVNIGRATTSQCLLLLLARATIFWCYSSRTSRSWWITQSTQHHRRGCNNIPSFLQRISPIARSLCEGCPWHDLHILVTAPFCWRVSHSVTHKHELWIWFTLSYAMMKALLRLAAVRDTKQAGEFRGDTVHFIASSSALVLMTQNGNIYRPLTQTATCLSRRYSSKYIAENS